MKTLNLNGKSLSVLAKDGKYWVAIKPICEALNVQYVRQFKNIKTHKIFGQLLSEQTIVGADNKVRKMICLPERYVYGWIFQIRSASPQLAEYQKLCCDILYNHFHGSLTSRDELLRQKSSATIALGEVSAMLLDNINFTQMKKLEATIRECNKQLSKLDKERISNQLSLWES